MLFALSMSAFALDCADPSVDADTCATVVSLISDINAAYGAPDIVFEGTTARLDPDALYGSMEEARDLFDNVGCLSSGSLFAGGAYNSLTGVVDGGWEDSSSSGSLVDGSVGPGKSFMFDTGSAEVGVAYSAYNKNRKIIADAPGGLFAGRWVRGQGRRGVWIGAVGACTGEQSASIGTTWFGASSPVVPTTNTTTNLAESALEIVRVDLDSADNGSSPASETVDRAIDGVGQKYLNFGRENSGFAIDLGGEATLTELVLFTANDEVPRDPASYVLAGSNSSLDGPWTEISEGALNLPDARNSGGSTVLDAASAQESVAVDSLLSFRFYRLVFPTVKSTSSANSMQIGEVQFLGFPVLVD